MQFEELREKGYMIELVPKPTIVGWYKDQSYSECRLIEDIHSLDIVLRDLNKLRFDYSVYIENRNTKFECYCIELENGS